MALPLLLLAAIVANRRAQTGSAPSLPPNLVSAPKVLTASGALALSNLGDSSAAQALRQPSSGVVLDSGVGVSGFNLTDATAELGQALQASSVWPPDPSYQAGTSEQAAIDRAKAAAANAQATWQQFLAAHPKPASNAQPSVINDWLNLAQMSPTIAYPEWGWKVIQAGPPPQGPFGLGGFPLFEAGESVAAVQLGDHDAVTWYVHPSGAWEYHHVWGEDWTQVLSDIADAIGSAISDVMTIVHDVTNIIGTVLRYAQIAASFVPGVGQVVNEVVTAGEAAMAFIQGDNALQIGLMSAYNAALAAVPGLEALGPLIDPGMQVLKTIAAGKTAVTKAAIAAALNEVPDEPNIAGVSPRSIVASLAGWLAGKLGLAT